MNSLKEIPLEEKQSIMEMYTAKPVEVKEEDFLDDLRHLRLKNISKGIKGIVGGHGYYYFSTIQSIRKIINKIQKVNTANDEYIAKLTDLKNYVTTANIPANKKTEINNAITKISARYRVFQNELSMVESSIKKALD